jgi:hypothetical protein
MVKAVENRTVNGLSRREGRQMSVVPVKSIEEAFTPTDGPLIGATLSWSWEDIENLLGPEWEIGGSATPSDAIGGLIVGE